MSRENVEENVGLIRQFFKDFNASGVDALLALISPEFEATTPVGLGAEPQTYRGPNGVRRWFDSFDEIMDDIGFETHNFIAVGDRVVVPHSLHARGRATGIETEQYAVHVWHLRNGKAVKLELFATLDEALAAAKRP